MKKIMNRLAVCTAVVSVAFAVPAFANEVKQLSGVFEDGQEWQISVPANWNGVIVNDLDSVGNVESNSALSTYFLSNGYAYTGTRRHPDRNQKWDPAAESNNMVRVLDIFAENFGEATHTIQYGCSGGGSVGLSVAEDHPDRFDGVVSMHASTPIELANVRLDLTVALKALLGPDSDLPVIINSGEEADARAAWTAALDEAMATPEGRAKMALAAAVAQYPMWGSQGNPEAEKPDWSNPESVQNTMVRAAVDGVFRAVTGRPMWDNPAGIVSWTIGVDYHEFYANANEMQVGLVEDMYRAAGLDPETAIKADIDAINAFPRIQATESGIEYFRARTHTGDIGIPVLHVSNIADGGTPAVVMAGYEAKIERQGKEDLYRQAWIDASGHCTYNTAEQAALIGTIIDRIETGEWHSSAEEMNALGNAAGVGEARFLELDENTGFRLPETFNRLFFKDDVVNDLL